MSVTYRFKGFRLEDEQATLWHNNERINLAPQDFKVLRMLVHDSPATVPASKLAGLWDSSLENAKRSLAESINKIRKKLGDKKPFTIIGTRSSVGYELLPEVKKADSNLVIASKTIATPFGKMPHELILSTKRTNPQWTDFVLYSIPVGAWRLKSTVTTDHPYFRFGFKLFGENGRLFGDGSIQSDDPNLIVHIGRNNWPNRGIGKRDIFVTAYVNGRRLDEDKKLYSGPKLARVVVELRVDEQHAHLFVNGKACFRHQVPADAYNQVALLAWGDQDPMEIRLTNLSLEAIKR